MSAGLFDMEPLRTADIDPTGTYRYALNRLWGRPSMTVTFIMLNPSTADASIDDPTIRRCLGFARSWGAEGLRVVNLFALRATDPRELARHADPVGPGNDAVLRATFRHPRGRVVAAWGSHPEAKSRAAFVRVLAAAAECPLWCLGLTKDGSPRHPLYVRADAELIRFGEPA